MELFSKTAKFTQIFQTAIPEIPLSKNLIFFQKSSLNNPNFEGLKYCEWPGTLKGSTVAFFGDFWGVVRKMVQKNILKVISYVKFNSKQLLFYEIF